MALRKCGREKGRSAGLSKESAGEASNLMRRPEKPERNHIRLRGVGFQQYRKSVGFPQAGLALELLMPSLHQNGFTTTKITIPIIMIVGNSLIKR